MGLQNSFKNFRSSQNIESDDTSAPSKHPSQMMKIMKRTWMKKSTMKL